MTEHALYPHAKHPPSAVRALQFSVSRDPAGFLGLTYRVTVAAGALLLPMAPPPVRTDELWLTTCWELFIRPAGRRDYIEFNLAPSRAWAAYRFDDYRQGMADLALSVDPRIALEQGADHVTLTARVPLPADWATLDLDLAVTTVIEETDGTKSFWAISHPDDTAPEFHHPDSFTLEMRA